MGCSCCKEVNPQDYEKCIVARLDASKKAYHYVAPCGNDFQRGSNAIPKKKKKKRK